MDKTTPSTPPEKKSLKRRNFFVYFPLPGPAGPPVLLTLGLGLAGLLDWSPLSGTDPKHFSIHAAAHHDWCLVLLYGDNHQITFFLEFAADPLSLVGGHWQTGIAQLLHPHLV